METVNREEIKMSDRPFTNIGDDYMQAMMEQINQDNKITPQPEYDALHAFDTENNVEPPSTVAERIAARYGFHDKHPIVDDIHYAIEDALELGQRRGRLIPRT
jgi:phage gpG-like protein